RVGLAASRHAAGGQRLAPGAGRVNEASRHFAAMRTSHPDPRSGRAQYLVHPVAVVVDQYGRAGRDQPRIAVLTPCPLDHNLAAHVRASQSTAQQRALECGAQRLEVFLLPRLGGGGIQRAANNRVDRSFNGGETSLGEFDAAQLKGYLDRHQYLSSQSPRTTPSSVSSA